MIEVGTLVYAHRDAGVAVKGEVGVCYDVYSMRHDTNKERPGYGLIFQKGGYDGFSFFDITVAITPLADIAETIRDYTFENVGQLKRDYLDGTFNAAFQQAEDYLVANGYAEDRKRFLLELHSRIHSRLKAFSERMSVTAHSVEVSYKDEGDRTMMLTFFDINGDVLTLQRDEATERETYDLRREVEDSLRPLTLPFHYYLHSSPEDMTRPPFVLPFPTYSDILENDV
jgi:hypothetical protein